MSAAQKIRLVLARDGVRGLARTALARGAAAVSLREDHVWFVLVLGNERPRPPLADGLVLDRPREPDPRLLEQLTFTLTPGEVRARIDAGNDLWLVCEDGQALFGCWVFRGHVPTVAAPGGELALPADTVCLEDSLAAPAARGRGVAPGTYPLVADTVGAEGARWMITKVEVDNASARRAVEKAGFQEVALMHFTRRAGRSRTTLEPLAHPLSAVFVERTRAALRDGRRPGPLE